MPKKDKNFLLMSLHYTQFYFYLSKNTSKVLLIDNFMRKIAFLYFIVKINAVQSSF